VILFNIIKLCEEYINRQFTPEDIDSLASYLKGVPKKIDLETEAKKPKKRSHLSLIIEGLRYDAIPNFDIVLENTVNIEEMDDLAAAAKEMNPVYQSRMRQTTIPKPPPKSKPLVMIQSLFNLRDKGERILVQEGGPLPPKAKAKRQPMLPLPAQLPTPGPEIQMPSQKASSPAREKNKPVTKSPSPEKQQMPVRQVDDVKAHGKTGHLSLDPTPVYIC